MAELEYIRRGGQIRKASNGDIVFDGFINEAKKKSRELQTKGLGRGQVRVERHKSKPPGKKKRRTKYGRPLKKR